MRKCSTDARFGVRCFRDSEWNGPSTWSHGPMAMGAARRYAEDVRKLWPDAVVDVLPWVGGAA